MPPVLKKLRMRARLCIVSCTLLLLTLPNGQLVSVTAQEEANTDNENIDGQAGHRRQPKADAPRRDHWQVPTLPKDNLLKNPWFRDTLEPWVGDGHWQGNTTKWGNPTPGEKAGSAARISTGRRADSNVGKTVEVGKDTYLYQVVAADPANKRLKFEMYWVAHTLAPGEVTIYGGHSEKGPWTKLWCPFHQVHRKVVRPPKGRRGNVLWRHYSSLTALVATTIPTGYPYYKVEVHANLPDKRGGFKITGVYFTATSESESAPPKGQ